MSTPQLYSGWRRSHSVGIGSLNTTQTVIVAGALLIPVLLADVAGLATLPITLPIALVVIALAVWQRHGMPLLSYVAARARWQLAEWRGETSYRSLFQASPRAASLPGVAAPTQLLRVEDPTTGTRVGLVWNQRTGTMSATLLLSPAGSLLSPRESVSGAVRAWGDALADLADEDTVRAASVTLQITPSSGQALSDHVAARLDHNAPEVAREAVRELVAGAPRASAQLACWFSLVIDPNRAPERPADPTQAAAEVLRVLDGVDLGGAGADVLRRASDLDIKRLVRGGYTPADRDAPEAEIEELLWHEVGPSAHEDQWTAYRHDDSWSFSWVLREAPRKPVPYDTLLRLLAPGKFPRRLTLAYRVLPTEEAQVVVEREVNASDARAEYRTRTRRSTTRRERLDAERADRSASEEALGAGMVQWSIYITTTVSDHKDLAAARREVENAAKGSGLRFRPAFGAQAAALLVGLPVGVNPLA